MALPINKITLNCYNARAGRTVLISDTDSAVVIDNIWPTENNENIKVLTIVVHYIDQTFCVSEAKCLKGVLKSYTSYMHNRFTAVEEDAFWEWRCHPDSLKKRRGRVRILMWTYFRETALSFITSSCKSVAVATVKPSHAQDKINVIQTPGSK